MAEQYKTLHPIKYYRDYLAHGIRPDGREVDKFRPIIVNPGSVASTDGSALVKIGRTTVICGIKAEFCRPRPEAPNLGFLIPNVELPPLCSSMFKPGPPGIQAQVYTQLIADIIESSQCINLEELCIFPDKIAWCLFVDLICLDFDGAVVDACVIALMTALKSLVLPEVDYDPVIDNKQVNLENLKRISVKCIPVSTTFSIFEDKTLLADPTVDEENLCSGIVTVVTKNGEICKFHKPGGSPLTDDELMHCVEAALQRERIIHRLIKTALKTERKNK